MINDVDKTGKKKSFGFNVIKRRALELEYSFEADGIIDGDES